MTLARHSVFYLPLYSRCLQPSHARSYRNVETVRECDTGNVIVLIGQAWHWLCCFQREMMLVEDGHARTQPSGTWRQKTTCWKTWSENVESYYHHRCASLCLPLLVLIINRHYFSKRTPSCCLCVRRYLAVEFCQLFWLIVEQVEGVSIQADLLQTTNNQTAGSCTISFVCPVGWM